MCVIKLIPFTLCIILRISLILSFAARLIFLVAHWQFVRLLGSRDQCVVFLGDSLIALENDVTDRTVLEKELFWIDLEDLRYCSVSLEVSLYVWVAW